MNVLDLIEKEEGFRAKPYHCSEGYPTVGIGKRIGPKNAPIIMYEFEVSRVIAKQWLNDEVEQILHTLTYHGWFRGLNSNRQSVIVSMSYQMGVNGLLKFKKMIQALKDGDYNEAKKQALDSRWAKQTPARAYRHAESLRTGKL